MRRLTLLPLLILPLLAAAQEERPAWLLPIEEVRTAWTSPLEMFRW